LSINIASEPSADHLKRTRLRVVNVFFMIFIFVSGGPFGIEDMVSSSGPGLTLIMLLVLPLFWGMPMALVSSELGSAIPGEGGFYVWARRALGNFWGFQSAWWWALSILIDSTLYIVLSVSYLQNWLGFDQLTYYIVCWTIIALFAYVNIIGVKVVALGSTFFSMLVLAPFAVLVVVGFAQWQFNPLTPIVPADTPWFGTGGVLALGLTVGVWQYCGFEAMSTLSGEIRNPQYVIPRALMLAMPFLMLVYLLPTAASLAGFGHWQNYSLEAQDGGFSFIEIAHALGGSALGAAILASTVLANLAMYLNYLGSGARPLFAIASDGLFPHSVRRVSDRFGTPMIAIMVMAAANAILVFGPFRDLVVIDIMMLASAHTLIYISAVRLRIREPGLRRPFRAPVNTVGMVMMVTPPILIVLIVFYLNAVDHSLVVFGRDGLEVFGVNVGWIGIAGAIALLSGPLLYPLLRARYGGPTSPSATAGDHYIALAAAEARANGD
jgi:amino acid transporter